MSDSQRYSYKLWSEKKNFDRKQFTCKLIIFYHDLSLKVAFGFMKQKQGAKLTEFMIFKEKQYLPLEYCRQSL